MKRRELLHLVALSSLWESAELARSRSGASPVKRAGRHEFSMPAAWQSVLSGAAGFDDRNRPVAGVREIGAWLMWRSAGTRQASGEVFG